MRSLFLMGMFSTVSAWGCPDLSGIYSCPANHDSPASEVTASQFVENGVTTYRFVSLQEDGTTSVYNLVTDGSSYNLEEPTPDFEATYQASCDDEALNVSIQIKKPFDAAYSLKFTRDQGFKTDIIMEEEIVETHLCQKK